MCNLISPLFEVFVLPRLAKWLFAGHTGACLHGGGVPQIGEVTRLDGVTRLSI